MVSKQFFFSFSHLFFFLFRDNITARTVAPRLFCDICDMFDLHDTEDCPTQAMDSEDIPPPKSSKSKKPPVERPYCETCESMHKKKLINFRMTQINSNFVIIFYFSVRSRYGRLRRRGNLLTKNNSIRSINHGIFAAILNFFESCQFYVIFVAPLETASCNIVFISRICIMFF